MKTARYILVILFGLSLPVSISGAQILGGLLLADWLIRSRKNGPAYQFKKSPLDVPILIFIIWGLLTSLLNQSVGLPKAFTTQSALMFFFVLAHMVEKKYIKPLLISFCVGSVLMAVLGIAQVGGGINYLPHENQYVVPSAFTSCPDWFNEYLAMRNGRAVGSRSHPLTFAEGSIPSFFILFALVFMKEKFKDKSSKTRAYAAFGLLLVTAALLLAQGRAVWLAILAGLVVMSFSVSRKYIKGLAGLFIVGSVLILTASPIIKSRVLSIMSPSGGSQGDRQSISMRVLFWRHSWDQIKKNPAMGVGLKGLKMHIPDPHTKKPRVWAESHNIFLQTGVDRGIIGLGLLIWILFIAFQRCRLARSPWDKVVLAIFLGFMLMGLTESWMKDKEVAIIFWTMLGMVQAAKGKERNQPA